MTTYLIIKNQFIKVYPLDKLIRIILPYGETMATNEKTMEAHEWDNFSDNYVASI